MEGKSKITEGKVLLKKSKQIINVEYWDCAWKIIGGIKSNVTCSKIIDIISNVLVGYYLYMTYLNGKEKKLTPFNSDIYAKVQISWEFLDCLTLIFR